MKHLTSCAAGLLLATALAATNAATPLRDRAKAVLAPLDGEVQVPGLRQPVEVLRDHWGIPHIYAQNDEDLFFAQGFVAAQDRLFQLDLWRRIGLGETAAVLGRKGLEADRFARLLRYRGDMHAEWTSYSPDAERIATAFTRGINACIDQMGDRLPIEFELLGCRPAKWRPEDCLGRMSGIIMTSNFRQEVSRAELIAAVGVEKARMLAPTDPPRAFAAAPGLDLTGIDRAILAGFRAATGSLPFERAGGSNNWVLAGARSVSGKPLLASDPHRAISLPSLRYIVHLNAPGWNVIGAGEPGLPGVALGHNERVAWGFTIVGTDQADLYVEETHPDDPARYRVGTDWERMRIVREKVAVRGEAQLAELELRFTRHGPVIHQDEARRRAFVLRWVGSEPGGAAYFASLALDRARSAAEFRQALARWKVPALNIVYADVEGRIGWVAAGLTPIRRGWDGLLPVPGATGEYEWQGFLSLDDLPQRVDPPEQYLATANHNILPPGYSREISYEWAPPFRFLQIKRRLEAKPRFDLEDMKSIQHDNTSIPGQVLARLLAKVEITDPELKPYADLMRQWDGVLSVDAAAGPLYGFWLRELTKSFYQPHVPERLMDFVGSRGGVVPMLQALEGPDARWFGADPAAGRDRLLRESFTRAVRQTVAALGPDPRQWAWGRLHVTPFHHPLAVLGPDVAQAFNLGTVPRPGDGHTPNAAGHNERFEQTTGASYRHVFDLADWDRGLATSTPGQSGQPGSPHYADLLPLWAKGEYFPLAYSRPKVEEVTRHRLRLVPASR
ncbi:MAG: penicillin acylase family protein [Gemmataceae bacterium]|nr:penicillin acylase family protein [Gemmataceae bacterium]MDW8264880.1 penicillin acylase family protein [Gemmataceae bacterium]